MFATVTGVAYNNHHKELGGVKCHIVTLKEGTRELLNELILFVFALRFSQLHLKLLHSL